MEIIITEVLLWEQWRWGESEGGGGEGAREGGK